MRARNHIPAPRHVIVVGLGVVAVLIAAYLSFADRSIGGSGLPSGATRSSSPTSRPSEQVTLSGTVIPARHADLALPVAGRVKEVLVPTGSEVEQDDVLFTLDDPGAEAEVERAEAEVARATAELELAQAQRSALPSGAPDAEVAIADAAAGVAAAQLAQARASLSAAEATLAETQLRAPFAGTVVSIEVEAGEHVAAGRAVATIADLSGWLIETQGFRDAVAIAVVPGESVELTFNAIPDLVVSGIVRSVSVVDGGQAPDEVVADDVATHVALIEPAAVDPRIRWGLGATVAFPLPTATAP